MAWQGIVSSPDVAKENKHQIVETEHLMKALLEQKNGLARRIFSKAGIDNTRLLEATDKFIQRQPKVILIQSFYCQASLWYYSINEKFFVTPNVMTVLSIVTRTFSLIRILHENLID